MSNKVWDGKISSLAAEFKTQLPGMLNRLRACLFVSPLAVK